jgi:hypothetical protein
MAHVWKGHQRPLLSNSYPGSVGQLAPLRFVNSNNSGKRKLHIRSQSSNPVTTTLSPLVNCLFIESKSAQISLCRQGIMGFLILSKFKFQNQVLINLDKREKYSRITSHSDELKTPSDEDNHLAEASRHPQKDQN